MGLVLVVPWDLVPLEPVRVFPLEQDPKPVQAFPPESALPPKKVEIVGGYGSSFSKVNVGQLHQEECKEPTNFMIKCLNAPFLSVLCDSNFQLLPKIRVEICTTTKSRSLLADLITAESWGKRRFETSWIDPRKVRKQKSKFLVPFLR